MTITITIAILTILQHTSFATYKTENTWILTNSGMYGAPIGNFKTLQKFWSDYNKFLGIF